MAKVEVLLDAAKWNIIDLKRGILIGNHVERVCRRPAMENN
jgi:hypothetical protein